MVISDPLGSQSAKFKEKAGYLYTIYAVFGKNFEIECTFKPKTAQAWRKILPVLFQNTNRHALTLRHQSTSNKTNDKKCACKGICTIPCDQKLAQSEGLSMIHQYLYPKAMASKHLKIASVTMQCDPEPEKNRTHMREWVVAVLSQHPNVDVILFGETILGWYAGREGTKAYHRRIAEAIPGETTRLVSALARENGVYLCFGMMEIHQDELYNAQLLINPQGEIDAVHRKFHLMESAAIFKPGKIPVTVVDIKGIRTGIIVCSDIQNGSVRKALKKQKVALILGGLASPKDPNFFVSGMIAKLFDSWIVTANRYGKEDGYVYDGNMIISNPLGEIIQYAIEKEHILCHRLHFVQNEPVVKHLLRRGMVAFSLMLYFAKHIGIQAISRIRRK